MKNRETEIKHDYCKSTLFIILGYFHLVFLNGCLCSALRSIFFWRGGFSEVFRIEN